MKKTKEKSLTTKVALWILFLPFMLIYWGLKKKNKPMMIGGIVLAVIYIGMGALNGETNNTVADTLTADQTENILEMVNIKVPVQAVATTEVVVEETESVDDTSETIVESTEAVVEESQETEVEETQETSTEITESTEQVVEQNVIQFDGYTMIEVDGGNLSGHREPNVVVDIGFGDREYWAFTNEHGQLVKVIAKEIILQNESTEPVLSTGRYYRDEAKVLGTESPTLDEGHIIADSLGGVANAYNITPQESTLNRHGDQAYMEKNIRDAGGCTDFTALITYPDTQTQIPSHYSFTYTLLGTVQHDEFDNINPDEVNAELGLTTDTAPVEQTETPVTEETSTTETAEIGVQITALDKKEEYIILKNKSTVDINLNGWIILSVLGEQDFVFGDYLLTVGATVKVGDSGKTAVDIHWLEGRGVWNNSKSDPAELFNNNGLLIHRWND